MTIRCFSPWVFVLATSSAIAFQESAESMRSRQSPNLLESDSADASQFVRGVTSDYVTTGDSAHFYRNVLRVGAMVHHESPFKFVSLGLARDSFRQQDWWLSSDSISVQGRRIDRQTAEGLTGRLALTTNTKHPRWHGEATWNVRLTPTIGLEWIANRDAVESAPALDQGILSNFFGVSADYAPTDRLTLIAMPTLRRFTDGHEQQGARGWLIYNLLPQSGLSLEMKGQGFAGDGDSQKYFNPEVYRKGEVGLRLRQSFGQWRAFAQLSLGNEWINHDIEEPTIFATLTTRRFFDSGWAAGFQFTYNRSASSGGSSVSESGYAWRMARVFLVVPFEP